MESIQIQGHSRGHQIRISDVVLRIGKVHTHCKKQHDNDSLRNHLKGMEKGEAMHQL